MIQSAVVLVPSRGLLAAGGVDADCPGVGSFAETSLSIIVPTDPAALGRDSQVRHRGMVDASEALPSGHAARWRGRRPAAAGGDLGDELGATGGPGLGQGCRRPRRGAGLSAMIHVSVGLPPTAQASPHHSGGDRTARPVMD